MDGAKVSRLLDEYQKAHLIRHVSINLDILNYRRIIFQPRDKTVRW